jgi:molybdopterin-guanine dinucleotide biosynthesis protein A
MAGEATLAGLVLAGGRSTRMQRDKATLPVGGESQLARAMRLVGNHVDQAFVSVRADQREEPERARFPQIVDRLENLGPAAGILAAFDPYPDSAWLVVACDLPLLDSHTLRHLIEHRDRARLATAYLSASDRLPEPLCAIWEPASRPLLEAFLTQGKTCPRKFLINHDVALLDLPSARALHNVNTPTEYASVVNEAAEAPAR